MKDLWLSLLYKGDINMASKERVQTILKNVCKLNYWFAKEMFECEKMVKREKENLKAMEKSNDLIISVSGSEHNRDVMKSLLKDTVTIIDFLRIEENVVYLQEWQIKGVEAMFQQCKVDECIPYDLPGAIMAALGMWDELSEILNK